MKSIFKYFLLLTGTFILLISLAACSKNQSSNTVWIYTSMYPASVEAFSKVIKTKFPDLDVQWFQSGSEKVAARIALERASGDVKANLVMTSDYFWYDKLAKEGFWQNYKTTATYEIPGLFVHPDGAFTTVRVPAMIIAYNSKFVSDTAAPKSFKELSNVQWKSKVSSGSPLESGTNYGLMTNLTYRYGYEFLKELRQNDLLVAGGNSSALQRLVSGERPVAMLLLENALDELKKNPNIKIVYPQDGLILMPSPIAITRTTKNTVAAKELYDFFLSPEGQKIMIAGNMYSLDTRLEPPSGALAYSEVAKTAFEFSDKFVAFVRGEESTFKDKFSEIMFE